MASVQISYDPAPECQTMALEHNSLSPGRNCQENVSHGDKTDTTSNELDLLFSPMFDELLNGSSKVVSKSFAVSAADAPNQRQQPTTPLNNHTTPEPTCQNPSIALSVTSNENINQAEPHAENDEVAEDEFINIFSTPVQDQGETSCSWCGGPFNGGRCRKCTNVSFGDEFVRKPDLISNNETPYFSYPPSQPKTSLFDQFHCFGCGDLLEDGVRCQRCTCKWCGYNLREGFCLFCASRDGNSSIDTPNMNSFNDPPNVFTHPPQP
uniref:Uncharacterized protein n=1 Tax=Tanacetum cinerariifolium TaxID=118510 RepID=A0A699HBH8_TANCI|nr:hypothetical protein [Tanacetum cinerariifolium]